MYNQTPICSTITEKSLLYHSHNNKLISLVFIKSEHYSVQFAALLQKSCYIMATVF
jgi:hypothetical protein